MWRLSRYQSGRRGAPTGGSLRLILESVVLMVFLASERGTLAPGCPAAFSIVHRVVFQALDLLLHSLLTASQALLSPLHSDHGLRCD